MNVYIAGPITGVADYADRFQVATTRLAEAGHTPINPALLGSGDHPWDWYMREALDMLMHQANAVALLPGWEESKGARLEHTVAMALGLPVSPIDDWCNVSVPVRDAVAAQDELHIEVVYETGTLVRCPDCHGDGCAECDGRGVWKTEP